MNHQHDSTYLEKLTTKAGLVNMSPRPMKSTITGIPKLYQQALERLSATTFPAHHLIPRDETVHMHTMKTS